MHGMSIDQQICRIAAEQRRGGNGKAGVRRLSARTLEERTGYGAAGLTAEQLRERICAEVERQEAVCSSRQANSPAGCPAPGRILRLAREKPVNLRRTAEQLARCLPIWEAQARKGVGQTWVGGVVFRALEEGCWNRDRYSRAWHQRHGPVWEVSERRVEMLRVDRAGNLVVVASVGVEGFRGNWLVRAIAALLGLPTVRVPRPLKRVQMCDWFTVERVRAVGGVEIYRRRLAGEVIDLCAVVDGETYHAETARAAIAGLRNKLAKREQAASAQTASDAEVLTIEAGLRRGFCQRGMAAFCAHNGLDLDGAYTRGELRAIVARQRLSNLRRWGTELRQLGLA